MKWIRPHIHDRTNMVTGILILKQQLAAFLLSSPLHKGKIALKQGHKLSQKMYPSRVYKILLHNNKSGY
jgi:hypothetical protein